MSRWQSREIAANLVRFPARALTGRGSDLSTLPDGRGTDYSSRSHGRGSEADGRKNSASMPAPKVTVDPIRTYHCQEIGEKARTESITAMPASSPDRALD